ncbi:MAG: hypothetical protein QNJ18_01860 [Xenococcaceae cyanobacterium MO_167.B52]|nr:hypothetical protein [Xenococcaceae cyanobacterium MO_167.B52]
MICFKDFFPQAIEQRGFFSEDKYENFSSLLDQLNQWLAQNKVEIINIETVVLRDIDDEKTRFLAEEPFFYQFIRVWYQVPDEDSPKTEDVS